MRIRKELEEKGLDEDAIGRHVDTRASEWLDEIERVRRRKFGAALPASYEERVRQARFLQYRGFTHEQIRRALNSRAADLPESV